LLIWIFYHSLAFLIKEYYTCISKMCDVNCVNFGMLWEQFHTYNIPLALIWSLNKFLGCSTIDMECVVDSFLLLHSIIFLHRSPFMLPLYFHDSFWLYLSGFLLLHALLLLFLYRSLVNKGMGFLGYTLHVNLLAQGLWPY
jgi:hypothetical protein